MPCDICEHTLHTNTTEGPKQQFWCPRCGTMHEQVIDPKTGEVTFRSCESTTLVRYVLNLLEVRRDVSSDQKKCVLVVPMETMVAFAECAGRKL